MIDLTKEEKEKIKWLLRKRRVADYVIQGGLDFLIDRWKHFVRIECEKNGYGLTMNEYLNDLDGRTIIQYLMDKLDNEPLSKKIKKEISDMQEVWTRNLKS